MLFSSKWLYFIALLLSSLSKTSVMHNSVVTARNLAGTTSPISLFLLPVTFANKLLSVFAHRKLFNKRDNSIGIWTASLFFEFGCFVPLRLGGLSTPILFLLCSFASVRVSCSHLSISSKFFCGYKRQKMNFFRFSFAMP